MTTLDVGVLADSILRLGGVGGTLTLVGGALALGIRHGIDWDHIAAITDITSAAAVPPSEAEAGLLHEPGVMLTDERHHGLRTVASSALPIAIAACSGRNNARGAYLPAPVRAYFRTQQRPFLLGTLYALGHGAVVTLLGLLAIVAAGFLPDWVDPVMGRIVGVTLLFLSGYLYYSLYRYFRGGRFELRSRWMLVFAATRRAYAYLLAKLRRRTHHRHVEPAQQYGAATAFSVGLIHGVGAETGTQALVIAAAVGATSRAAGVVALLSFVVGLLIANSFVTVATTAGFVSTQNRQWIYVCAGLAAAIFSTVLGVVFVLGADSVFPELDRLFN